MHTHARTLLVACLPVPEQQVGGRGEHRREGKRPNDVRGGGGAAAEVEGAAEPCLEGSEGQEAGRGQRGLALREEEGEDGAWGGGRGRGLCEVRLGFLLVRSRRGLARPSTQTNTNSHAPPMSVPPAATLASYWRGSAGGSAAVSTPWSVATSTARARARPASEATLVLVLVLVWRMGASAAGSPRREGWSCARSPALPPLEERKQAASAWARPASSSLPSAESSAARTRTSPAWFLTS